MPATDHPDELAAARANSDPANSPIGRGDDDQLRVVQELGAHGRPRGSAKLVKASVTNCDHRQYSPNPARLGASCFRAHAG